VLANTSKETLFLFIDSSVDNVLLQTNSGCTVKFCNRLDFGAPRLG